MNTANYTATDSFPLTTEGLDFIQKQILILEQTAAAYGNGKTTCKAYTDTSVASLESFINNKFNYYYNANTPYYESGNREAAIAYVLNHISGIGNGCTCSAVIRHTGGYAFNAIISIYTDSACILLLPFSFGDVGIYEAWLRNGVWGNVSLRKSL